MWMTNHLDTRHNYRKGAEACRTEIDHLKRLRPGKSFHWVERGGRFKVFETWGPINDDPVYEWPPR